MCVIDRASVTILIRGTVPSIGPGPGESILKSDPKF